jgi:hypothetical protein
MSFHFSICVSSAPDVVLLVAIASPVDRNRDNFNGVMEVDREIERNIVVPTNVTMQKNIEVGVDVWPTFSCAT